MMKRERLWNSLYVILTIIVLLLIMTIPHIVMCNMQHSINQIQVEQTGQDYNWIKLSTK